MDSNHDELLSALRNAEEFISITLSKESLTQATENKRQKLETSLKNLINKSSGKNDAPLPPRPPIPAPSKTQEEDYVEDIYDDVAPDAIEEQNIKPEDQPNSPSHLTMEIKGIPNETQDIDTQESYEDMNNEETYDDTVNITSEENYAEPGKDDSTSEDIDYEVAEPKQPQEESDDVYEGVDAQEDTDNKTGADNVERRERSTTEELEMLTNPIKAADVEDVIYKGYLDKHRKKGKIYIGNKWQRRYCIVRSYAMYYFLGPNSEKQKGTILLPGYKASVYKQSKTNREFIITRDKDRTFTFQADSQEEMLKWMDAIHKGASGKISKHQSEFLDSLRSDSPEVDEDSSIKDGQIGGVEIYDDVNEDDDSGSATIDYEIPDTETSNTSQSEEVKEESGKEEAFQEDLYEMPEDEDQKQPAPAQPPRPAKAEPAAPVKPPPPDIPTSTEQDEELYDDVGVDIPEPESSTKPQIPERNIPLPEPPSDKPSPVMPRPALPPTPGEAKPSIPPRKNGVPLPPQPGKETTPPPCPPPEENTTPDKAPPPPPPEEETEVQDIDYANIYQALWDCNPDAEDELGFSRGDLIYIYEKPHSDWWIGSKYKPQGYETRLIPRNYLTEAYDA